MNVNRRRVLARHVLLTTSLTLLGAPAFGGCGSPGEGTVQVSPEARARLTPRIASKARGSRNRLVVERPIGIKSRGVAGTTTP